MQDTLDQSDGGEPELTIAGYTIGGKAAFATLVTS